MNLSDAFSWQKQQGEEVDDDEDLEMKLNRAKAKEDVVTAAQDLVSAISEAAVAAEDDVPRL